MNLLSLNAAAHRGSAGAAAAALCAAAAAIVLLAAGCGSKDNFAKVNGQAISKDDYIKALERAPVTIAGSQQSIPAGRWVLDQLIGNKIVMAEASRLGVAPSDADVQQRFDLQKRLMEQQMPDKTFEAAMKEQGTTPEEIKEQLRQQLAETRLLASRLQIKEEQIKSAYEKQKAALGLPERVQLRVIMAAPGNEFAQAQKMLQAKTDFVEVARQYNPPQLKASGGLSPQPALITQYPPQWQAKLKQTKEGEYFGPVAAPGQPQKIWIRVEKKMPAFSLSYEEAKPLLLQSLVQQELADPKNVGVQRSVMDLKMKADFTATEDRHQKMWQAVKQQAEAAGLGQETAGAGMASPTPPPGGG